MKLCLLFLFLLTNAFSDDLPLTGTLENRLSNVEIYNVLDFKLKDFKIESNTGSSRFSGILELNLAVEGNICGADPKTFSFNLTREKDNYSSKVLSLFVSQPYVAEPHITKGCLLYSRSSKTKVELEINEYVFTNKSEKLLFTIPLNAFDGTATKLEVSLENGNATVKQIQ